MQDQTKAARLSTHNARPMAWVSAPTEDGLPTVDDDCEAYDRARHSWEARCVDIFAERLVAIRAFVDSADVDSVFC